MRTIKIFIAVSLFFYVTILSAQIPTEGLVASFPFNGNANDESGNGHHGTVNGAILTADRFENSNAAFWFDGLDDYIGIAPSSLVDNSESITISCWIQRESTDEYGLPIHTGNQGRFGIHTYKDSIAVNVSTNSTVSGQSFTEFATSKIKYNQTQWTHVVLWYNGQRLRIYINGQMKGEIVAEGNIYTPQTSFLAFGVYMLFGTPNHAYYRGIVDDVNIYNRPLSEPEIAQLYGEFHESTTQVANNLSYNNSSIRSKIVGPESNCLTTNAYYQYDIALNENHYLNLNPENTSKRSQYNPVQFNYDGTEIQGTFTFDFWVKPTATINMKGESGVCYGAVSVPLANSGQNWAVYPGHNNPNFGVGITIGNNGIMVAEHSGNILVSRLSHSQSITEWTHVSVVYNLDSLSLYLNGILIGSRSMHCGSNPKFAPSSIASALYSSPYRGAIDEFRLWDIALSSAEIQSVKDKKLLTEVDGLRYYTSFDNGQFTRSLGDLGSDSLTILDLTPEANLVEAEDNLDHFMGNDLNALELFTFESLAYSWPTGSTESSTIFNTDDAQNKLVASAENRYMVLADTLQISGVICEDSEKTIDAFISRYQASKKSERCFTLTHDMNNQFGSIWMKNKIDFSKDTTLNFTIYMGERDGNGADGIAFLIHDDPRDTIHDPNSQVIVGNVGSFDLQGATGDDGGGLGYAMHTSRVGPNTIPGPHGAGDDPENHMIQPSVAIEFDTWSNNDVPDGNSGTDGNGTNQPLSPYRGWDHTSLVYNGDLYSEMQEISNDLGESGRILPLKPSYAFGTENNPDGSTFHNIEDNQAYTYEVHWFCESSDSQRLELWANIYDNSSNSNEFKYLIFSHTDSYIANVFQGETLLRVGFTGSTGGSRNEQTVCFNDENLYNYAADDYVSIDAGDSVVIDITKNELPGEPGLTGDPQIVVVPDHGQAVVATDPADSIPKIIYRPEEGFSGMDSLKYVRSDVNDKPYSQIDTATVYIDVVPTADGNSVTFSMADKNFARYQVVDIPITADGFQDLTSFQFTVGWDNSIMQYQGVKDFGIPGLEESSFVLVNGGNMTVRWNSANQDPVSLQDNSILFTLELVAVGPTGQSTELVFSDDPLQRQVSGLNHGELQATYVNGNLSLVDYVTLGGYIKTQKKEPVPGIEVELVGAMELTTTTDEFGWYNFEVIPDQLYHIAPIFDGDPADGISTLDIVIMQWHVLGRKFMMTNLDLLACDVNGTGSLTTLDLAETRAVVLRNKDRFNGKNTVEFVNDEYTGEEDVYTFKNYLDIVPTTSHLNLNFTAVKRGDANQSWRPKTNNGRKVNYQDQLDITMVPKPKGDAQIGVGLTSGDIKNIVGLQFTLQWDPSVYDFEYITPGELNFVTNDNLVDEGVLTVSWNSTSTEGATFVDMNLLSSIVFTALDEEGDPDIRISSDLTPALAFDSNLNTFDVRSTFREEQLQFQGLITVYPNPAGAFVELSGHFFSESNYRVFTTSGIEVLSGEMTTDRKINVSSLKKGMYILQVSNAHQNAANLRFIKE